VIGLSRFVTIPVAAVAAICVLIVVIVVVRISRERLTLRRRRRDLKWLSDNLVEFVTPDFIDYLSTSLDAEASGPLERVVRLWTHERRRSVDALETRLAIAERRIETERMSEAKVALIAFTTFASSASVLGLLIVLWQSVFDRH